ncbi:MAG: DUF1643 domain-containing protein [Oscillospiraceae bacterium]|nr:DUF1643 domain-containing protein [Oscillospiraceae bacterium]
MSRIAHAVPALLPPLPVEQEPAPANPLRLYDYENGAWYYEPNIWCDHRYILGRPGSRPLVCVGINPSTANPAALDPTLKSVERLALANGFDGWIMFNVYPQRATDPNDMHTVPNLEWHTRNLAWLEAVLQEKQATMWAAWGTLIEKRDYLPDLMRELVAVTDAYHTPWVRFGAVSRAGHPHHPLYLRKDEAPQPFDVKSYLDSMKK